MKTIKDILAAHSRSVIVGASQINSALVRYGLSWDDVTTELEETKDPVQVRPEKPSVSKRAAVGFVEKPTRKCDCGGIIKVFSVHQKTKEFAEGMRSKEECCGSCGYKPCGFVEYSKQTLEEMLKIDND